MKAICVLESILRRKDDENFSIIESYFIENRDAVARCSESPQASLREKANKVFIFSYNIVATSFFHRFAVYKDGK